MFKWRSAVGEVNVDDAEPATVVPFVVVVTTAKFVAILGLADNEFASLRIKKGIKIFFLMIFETGLKNLGI